jgi:hypothetical protein
VGNLRGNPIPKPNWQRPVDAARHGSTPVRPAVKRPVCKDWDCTRWVPRVTWETHPVATSDEQHRKLQGR